MARVAQKPAFFKTILKACSNIHMKFIGRKQKRKHRTHVVRWRRLFKDMLRNKARILREASHIDLAHEKRHMDVTGGGRGCRL